MSTPSTLSQIVTFWSLLRHPRKTRDQIIAFQNTQLRRLIKHAHTRVPYYRKLFDSNGIKPEDIRSGDDLQIIPVTSRKDLQNLPAEDLISEGVNPDSLIVQRTAGTTGIPLAIRRTPWEERLLLAFYLRSLHGYGLKRKDKGANVRLYRRPNKTLLYRMRRALGLYCWDHVDCLQEPLEILRTLQETRANVLTGYPGILFQCADSLLNTGGFAIEPRFIVTGGEVLTSPMRKRIKEAFGSPVYDTYNSNEFRLLAWECKETGDYHTCDDDAILEVLRNGRPAKTGERGEVVGTNLHAFSMPFIRYRLGDIVKKGADICPCGQPFSTIREIEGRTADYFPIPDGRLIHPCGIVRIIAAEAGTWLRQYQVIQERMDRIVLRMVTHTAPPVPKISRIKESVHSIVGQNVEFEAIVVPEIKPEPSGKFQVFRSLVKWGCRGMDQDH